ncbi:vestitone reductase-like [Prosopis cineraria]|uniref:vestitone reductase-like n=1 Tax=Prosopis cineraria TaxID=364024 RepID=UPI00240EDC58|nr:vestitone reductase-like [Prosopis cineraria]
MEEGKGTVCVTGGTGFIGSWIIKRLLEDGYSVNATIRSHPDLSFLTNLPGASQKLQIFKNAELNNPDSFKEAIEGCMGVFHVATPLDLDDPEEVLTKRSIDGALGILKACLASKTVKRVVYTSSGVTVSFDGKKDDDNDDEVMKDEKCWSDIEYLRSLKTSLGWWSYAICKTLTEKAMLEFGEQNGLEVVTLLPTHVLGSFICPKLHGSHRTTLDLAFGGGDSGAYLQTPVVHVDDVARAHIFLLEHPNPKGRYICSACSVTIEDIYEILSVKYPEFQIPTREYLKEMKGPKFSSPSSKKLMDAGFEFKYGVEEIIVDSIESCKENGYL